MSFILDALRKAETTRQSSRPPGLQMPTSIGVPKPSWQRSWWPPLALLAVLAVVIAVYLVRTPGDPEGAGADVASSVPAERSGRPSAPAPPDRDANPTEPAPGGRPAVRALSAEAERGSRAASPARDAEATGQDRQARVTPGTVEVRDLLVESGLAPPVDEPATTPGSVDLRAVTDEAPASGPTQTAGSVSVETFGSDDGPRVPGTVEVRDLLADESGATAPSPDAGVSEPAPVAQEPAAPPPPPDVPTIQELIADGRLSTPSFRIDLLVYNANPDRSSVYINMRRYRVGDRTPEDALIEAITPDGAILRYQGRRFLLTPG